MGSNPSEGPVSFPGGHNVVPLYLNGKTITTDVTFDVTSPLTNSVAWKASSASDQDALAAVASAAQAFPAWRKTKPAQRRDIFIRAHAVLKERFEQSKKFSQTETGASDGMIAFEYHLALELLLYTAGLVATVEGSLPTVEAESSYAMVLKEPYGVVLAIAPWNAPHVLGLRACLVPLAAGNTVVLKGPELSPATYHNFVDALHQAGLPPGTLNTVFHRPADAARITQLLIEQPEVRKVNFTGSSNVGAIVAGLSGRNLKPCLLELGGKAPAIVCNDADLQLAANTCVFAAFLHAGQICMSTERIIVHSSVLKEFRGHLEAAGKSLQIEQLVASAPVEKNKNLVQEAVSKGARTLFGAPDTAVTATQMYPVVVENVSPDAKLYATESFGPTVSLYSVESDEEAIRLANNTDYGLSASVFTRDLARGFRIARQIVSGAVHINGPTVHDEAGLPHGGAKSSGFGRFGGKNSLEEWVQTKSMDKETTQDRNERIHALWKRIDSTGDGQVDLHGLKKGLKKIDHPLKNADSLLQDVLKAVDTSGDGQIQFSEFRVFVEHAERELWQLFESIDKDNSGALDKEEMRAAFKRAGLTISNAKLDQFFDEVDTNHDGEISFEEWRDFLLFLPSGVSNLRAIFSYYSATANVNQEGDVHINDTLQGFGYFIAGGMAGMVSRTATAPLDRLKVYLIAQTKPKEAQAATKRTLWQTVRGFGRPLVAACKDLWQAGGLRSLFAGNGLNVAKVMPESAIKFGAYESAKRFLGKIEGEDPHHLHPTAQFLAGGFGGVVSQCVVYPLDTLKFRMQCETVQGGLHGNALIAQTARTMWNQGRLWPFYRGLGMGLAGMFPYSAIDLFIFENAKWWWQARKARELNIHEDDVEISNIVTASIGASSGAISATAVYPINLLRTRLQAQGTVLHPPTYTGIVDVTRKTIHQEGFAGLFKGVTPNLLKVAPAVGISYVVYENTKALLGLH
ncbi:hypothetical protein DV735_g79, partial [Chaetothyriales sp. CBS 134920]